MRRQVLSIVFLTILALNQFKNVASAEEKKLDIISIGNNTIRTRTPNLGLNPPKPNNVLLQPTQQNNKFSVRGNSQVTIPKFSAITTIFCSEVKFNHEQPSSFPVTLSLARPIMDMNGNIIAPVNSLVSANVDANGNEIKIKPNALVIGGRYIPIETDQVAVPALIDTRRITNTFSRSFDRGQRGVAFRVSDNLIDWLALRRTTTVLEDNTSTLLGFGLSIATGIAQGLNEPDPPEPEETQVREIQEGIKIIFPLKSSVELPPMPSYKTPYFTNRTPSPVCKDGEAYQNQTQFINNNSKNRFDDEID